MKVKVEIISFNYTGEALVKVKLQNRNNIYSRSVRPIVKYLSGSWAFQWREMNWKLYGYSFSIIRFYILQVDSNLNDNEQLYGYFNHRN